MSGLESLNLQNIEHTGTNLDLGKAPLSLDSLCTIVASFEPVCDLIEHTESVAHVMQDETAIQLCIADARGVWFLYKLRDRRCDGPAFKQTPLTQWKYDGEVDVVLHGATVEESTYFLDPRYPLEHVYSHEESMFIQNPFFALEQANSSEALLKWLWLYEKITAKNEIVYPGFFSQKNIPGLRRHILQHSRDALSLSGITHLTAVPTWYHTAQLYKHLGFSFQNKEDACKIEQLSEGLKAFNLSSPQHESWHVVFQFWAQKAERMNVPIPKNNLSNVLRGTDGEIITYPLTPERNVWMFLTI